MSNDQDVALDIAVTPRQLRLICHTLGIMEIGPCPREFYRNNFCLGETPSDNKDFIEIKALESLGLMEDRTSMGQRWSIVTDFGVHFIRLIRGTTAVTDEHCDQMSMALGAGVENDEITDDEREVLWGHFQTAKGAK